MSPLPMSHAEMVEVEMRLQNRERTDERDPRLCGRCAFGVYRSGITSCSDYPGTIHEGDRIRIPKGARVRSFNWDGERPAGRSYTVTVNHFIGNVPRWAGSGGYWTWTEDWEVIAEPEVSSS